MNDQRAKSLDALPLPILFASNAGQWPEQVAYKADMAGGYSIWFEKNRLLIDARGSGCEPLQVVLTHSDEATLSGEIRSQHFSNYYIGNDSTKWHEGVPSYSSIRFENIADGVDLLFYSNSRKQLEFDYELAPGASISNIRREFIGADSIVAESPDKLAIYFAGIVLYESIPVSYAKHNSYSQPFSTEYEIAANEVGFASNDDELTQRVVDPVLFLAAYIGGGDSDELLALETDISNSCWLVGSSRSANYPQLEPAGNGGLNDPDTNNTLDGLSDVVITRVSGNGDILLWSTFMGGTSSDEGSDLAFDNPTTGLASSESSDIYITGRTASSNFPRYPATLVSGWGGNNSDDAFVAKLTGSFGRIVWSRYYGGAGEDIAYGIAVSASGRTFITGTTRSDNLPLSQPPFPAPLQNSWEINLDAFAASFSQIGVLEYGTYLNGDGLATTNGDDYAYDIEMSNDTAYIVGATSSRHIAKGNVFPFNGVFDTNYVGLHPFVIALNELGSSRPFGTYLGRVPHDTDLAFCIEMGRDSTFWIGGTTYTGNFMQQFLDTIYTYKQFADGGDSDAWLIRFNHELQQVLSWTFLGGDGDDAIVDLQVDDLGNVYFGGYSTSDNVTNMGIRYPLVHSPSGYDGANNRGGREGLIGQFSNTGRTLHFLSFYGGADDDEVHGVGFGVNERGFACGLTSSNDWSEFLPVLSPSGTFSWNGGEYNGGPEDGFLTAWDCCIGSRGNIDGSDDESVDILDLTIFVSYLFINFETPPCFNEANLDGAGVPDLLDLTILVDPLFISFASLPNCP